MRRPHNSARNDGRLHGGCVLSPISTRTGRYWRTARHLKPVQIYGRLFFRLSRPRPQLAPAPPVQGSVGAWTVPARRTASMIGPWRFRFLNLVGDLDVIGWENASLEKLWIYNQHYFDDLNAWDAGSRVQWHHDVIADWVASNPPGRGSGWEPYPTSLRIVNWVKWALAGNALPKEAIHSLAVQARWLMHRLEWHLLGNHLFVNAKALIFAGLFFDGPESDVWLDKGMSILRREVGEQILPDGGQFELSPMYHGLAVEDVLDLINVTRCFADVLTDGAGAQAAAWSTLLKPMRLWLSAMCHPDGEIAFFNDAAIGVAPTPAELERYALALGFSPTADLPPMTLLDVSGYARMDRGRAVLIADVGPVGPDYLPAHAHADTLSFELSLDGRRLIVNSGTSVYGNGDERVRQRGTAAHSTLVLDETDSSEVWGGFRVGRRARVVDTRTLAEGPALMLEAAHDGYRHLAGRPIHRRRWSLSGAGLSVFDEIEGSGSHAAAIYFHFGPDVAVSPGSGTTFRLTDRLDGRELAIVSTEPRAEATVVPTTWHPHFGCSQPASCLKISGSGPAPFGFTTAFRWSSV